MWQEAAALRDFNPTFVRFGSGADITRLLSNVRFTPQSGQNADILDVRFVPKADLRTAAKVSLFDHLVGTPEVRESGTVGVGHSY